MWQKITRCRPVARFTYIEGGLVLSGGIKCLKCGYFFWMGHHFQSPARALIATSCWRCTSCFTHNKPLPFYLIPAMTCKYHHGPYHTTPPPTPSPPHPQHTHIHNTQYWQTHTQHTHITHAQYTHTYCRRVLICIIHNRERHVYIKALNFLSRYNRLIGQFLANYLLVEMKQRGSHRRMYTCPVMPQIRASYTCSLDPPTQHT